MEYEINNKEKYTMEIYEENPLTEMEKKIIFLVAGLVNKTDQGDKTYEFPIREFYSLLESEGLTSPLQFKEILEELMSKVVEIPRQDGGWLMTHWIGSITYLKDTEAIRFTLSPKLIPYYLQLKRHLSL